jgi:vacuolar protein sorting-associated protein 35
VTAADALRFVGECAASLAEEGASPQAALALFLAAALGASAAGLELVAYDGFERAFLLYEDGIPGSAAQRSALGAVTGALVAARRLGPDSRAALAGKVASYASTLLRKADQCRALCACAYLHWQPEDGGGDGGGGAAAAALPPRRDGEAAVACLRRALKAAAASGAQAAASAAASPADPPTSAAGPSTPAALYTEVLAHLIRLAGDGCPPVTGEMVQNLADLIGTELQGGKGGKAEGEAAAAFYRATAAQGRAVGGVLAGVRWE